MSEARTITVFKFMPFPSRADRLPVVGLRFTYDATIVETIKNALRPLHPLVRDRAHGIVTADVH